MSINPLLAFSSSDSVSSLQFDLLQALDVYESLDPSLVPRLLEPATDPPLAHIVIISPLKWPIQVSSGQWARLSRIFPPSRVLAQEYVAILDVLNALYNSLHELVSGKFASPFYNNSESVDYSFRARVETETDSARRDSEMKKLDYLCGRTKFLGLSTTLQEHGRVVEAHFGYGKLRPGIHCILNKQVSDAPRYTSSNRSPVREGTRRTVLKSINDWLDDPRQSHRICWLYGPAGSGKSAIAQTIATDRDNAGKLGATFFFFRADSNRNTAGLLFPTLAAQLASSTPEMSERIDKALLADPQLLSKAIDIQFKHLIRQPFEGLDINLSTKSLSKLIIIDGVDECLEDSVQDRFLNDIRNAIDGGIPLRFLLCSRPELHIFKALSNATPSNKILPIVLEENEESLKDIRTFLEDEFDRISQKQGISSWYSDKDIDQLRDSSSGNFIYAVTVAKFVDSDSPRDQLDIVLGLQSSNASPFGLLDQLYIEILKQQQDEDLLKKFLRVFVVFVAGDILQHGADINTLFRVLIDSDVLDLASKLPKMHSLLEFSIPIVLHHKSFLDFLLSKARSDKYHVDKRQASREFLEGLLKEYKDCASKTGQPDQDEIKLFRISKCLASVSPRHLTDDWWEVLDDLRQFRNDKLAAPQFDVLGRSVDSFLSHTSSSRASVRKGDHIFQVIQGIRYSLGI